METIRVIGVDNKIYLAEPHKTITLCGIKIRTKKITDNIKLLSCYQCTY